MTPTEEICKNCEHHNRLNDHPVICWCLVWNRLRTPRDTCQHFQIAERLVIKRERIKVRFASRAEVEKAHDWVIETYGPVLKKLADS